jgi:WD40 repeat protein
VLAAPAEEELKLTRTLSGHKVQVKAVLFTNDGKALISGARDGTLKRWNTSTGRAFSLAGHYDEATGPAGPVWCLALSDDGKMLASGGAGFIKVWDAKTGQLQGTLRGARAIVLALAFSPDGKALVSLARTALPGSVPVQVWNMTGPRLRGTLETRPRGTAEDTTRGTTVGGAISPDTRTVARGYVDHTVKLWDLATARVRTSFKVLEGDGPFYALAFSPDGKTLAAVHAEGGTVVQLWDVEREKLRHTLKLHDFKALGSVSVAFSADGKTVAAGDYRGTLKVWDTATGRLRASATAHEIEEGGVSCLALSPDGKFLATATGKGAEPGSTSRPPPPRPRGGCAIKLWELKPAK